MTKTVNQPFIRVTWRFRNYRYVKSVNCKNDQHGKMLQGFEKNRTIYFGVIGPEISIFF